MTEEKFPPGGPREPVYQFLRSHGFVVSNWSDKHWTRADGLHLHLYGSGSMARIFSKDEIEIADGALETAVAKVTTTTTFL